MTYEYPSRLWRGEQLTKKCWIEALNDEFLSGTFSNHRGREPLGTEKLVSVSVPMWFASCDVILNDLWISLNHRGEATGDGEIGLSECCICFTLCVMILCNLWIWISPWLWRGEVIKKCRIEALNELLSGTFLFMVIHSVILLQRLLQFWRYKYIEWDDAQKSSNAANSLGGGLLSEYQDV